MYIKESKDQLEFENFHLPFNGKLDKSNRWVKLSKIIPWDDIEDKYSKKFSEKKGAPAIRLRIAIGALIIKERLGISDEETVTQISENPYLQYFLGFKEYQNTPPFDSSMMVHFRKRINLDMMAEINDLVIASKKSKDMEEDGKKDFPEQDKKTTKEKENDGVLMFDASCAPADIRYPTDIS